jgi:hypothetical protein
MRFLTFLYLLFALVGYPAVESPLPKILDTYGGQEFLVNNARVELSGTAENRKGIQPFLLQISGDKSLMTTPERIIVRNGTTGQWAETGKARSYVRRVVHGTQDVFLLPQFFVSRLVNFQYEDRADGLDWFTAEVLERRFIGYKPPAQTIRLGFDSKSHLLTLAEMHDPAISGKPIVVSYSNYADVSGIPVPQTITRTINDRLLLCLKLDAIDWNPAFSDEELSLVKGGS